MMRLHVFSAAALAGALALFLCPDSVQAETLRDAVRASLQSHPTIESALASREVVKEEEREEYSGLFPEINTSATGGRIFGDNSTSRGLVTTRGTSYSWLWEGNASVSQPLFDGLETLNRIDAARARLSSSTYEVSDTKENLALRAVQAYLNVLRTREIQSRINVYYETLNDYLRRIHLMVDNGAADEAEAKQARNIIKLLEGRAAQFDGDVQRAYAEYQEVVGRMPEGALSKPSARHDLVYKNLEDCVSYAGVHHPLILAGEKELEAASYDIDAEKGTIYPDLSGEISYLKKDQVEELGGELLDQRALLRLNWSFSTGGAQLARIRRSKAEYSDSLARSRDIKRQVERDVRQAHAEARTAEKQVVLLREREEIVTGLFETYKAQFEGAKVRILQLMQAKNQLFSVQLEVINTEYRYLASQYALLAGMGMLLQSLDADDASYPRESLIVDVDVKPGPEGNIYPAVQDQYVKTIQEMEDKIAGAKEKPKAPETEGNSAVYHEPKPSVSVPEEETELEVNETETEETETEETENHMPTLAPLPDLQIQPEHNPAETAKAFPEFEPVKDAHVPQTPVTSVSPAPIKRRVSADRNVYPEGDYEVRNVYPEGDYEMRDVVPDGIDRIYSVEDYPGFTHQ